MGQHDLSYRQFFSHLRMIRDLLQEIVGEQWVLTSPVADLIRLETSRNWREVYASVLRLKQNLAPSEAGLRKAFESWLRDVILPRLGLSKKAAATRQTLEEVETMLAESIDQWNREIREEGRQEGREEGRKEGRREGEARLVLRQLRLKFGPLESATEDRVRSADADLLLAWGERVLTAESLEDVFAD